jgi:hypothetical protein
MNWALATVLAWMLALSPSMVFQGLVRIPGPGGEPSGASATTFTYIETVGATSKTNCTSGITLTFGTATTSNELITVSWMEEPSGGATTITDSNSSAYTKDWELTSFAAHLSSGEAHFYTLSTSITTVTVTGISGTVGCVVSAAHFKRSSGSWLVDKTGAASNTGITATPFAGPTGGITTTSANEVIIGQVGVHRAAGGNCAVGVTGSWIQGYQNAEISVGNAMQSSYQIVSSTQTALQNTGTVGTCTSFSAAPGLVSFK